MSVKSMGMGVVAAVLAASLAACGQSQQQSNSASSAGASSQAVASDTSVAGARLTVQPATVDGCKPNQPIVADVSWDSSAPKVRVMVTGPGQATPRLFSESGYTGSAKTGEWVAANTTFLLINADTGAELARHVVTETPCAK